jgi:HD-GYP domain-containing protein (c-di-GMP phosphodiesterase class II)
MGGDEFVLFLPQTDLAYAQALVENIKQTIAKERVARASVSVSFGCRTKTDSSESLSMVFRQAEDAMYSHKFMESNQHKLETIGLITSSMYEKGLSEYRHGERVRDLCIETGEALQLDCHSVHDLGVAGLLHDIGKIGIDAHLIDKQGPLDEFEWQEIRRHSEIGYSILSSVHEYVNIAGYVLSHHERIDGKGYPRGLKGEEIPLQARVIAVANAYDSMTQERQYKERLDMVSASKELQKHVGSQFDMDVTRVFIEKVLKLAWN